MSIGSKQVLKDLIARELRTSAPSLSSSIQERLGNIASAYLDDQISFNYALASFAECGCPPTLITKLAHLKVVGDDPLPARCEETNFIINDSSNVQTRKKAVVWSDEEDMRLIAAVSRFGKHDWRMIAAFVGSGRTSSQCNQRWTRALDPSIIHSPWTPEEDQILIEVVSSHGCSGWRNIAKHLAGRTDLQCRHRYLQITRKASPKLRLDENKTDQQHSSDVMVDIPDPHEDNPMNISYFLNNIQTGLVRNQELNSHFTMLPPLIPKYSQCL